MSEVRWPSIELGRLTKKIGSGATPTGGKGAYLSSGIPLIRSMNVHDLEFVEHELAFIDEEQAKKLDNVVTQSGDVLLNITGASVARCCSLPERYVGGRVNQHVAILRPDPSQLDGRFLAYVLVSPGYKGQLLSIAGAGATREALTKSGIERFTVPAPPVETQRRIAAILGAYDDLIEVNRRRVAVLEEMARGLFEEWFVRFRFPGYEDAPIVDTPDGPLPEGWEFAALQDFLVLQRGFDLPKSKRVEGAVPVFSASGYHGGHNEHRVAGPGVVTGRSGTIGQVHLVWDDFWPLNTTLYVREFRRAGPVFAFLLLQRLDLVKHASGSAVPTLNRNHVHGIKLPAPPTALAGRFEAVASPMYRAIRNLELENLTLAASRDLLLPRLISGQLSVEAAERELEDAA